jgi:hypothetical protein
MTPRPTLPPPRFRSGPLAGTPARSVIWPLLVQTGDGGATDRLRGRGDLAGSVIARSLQPARSRGSRRYAEMLAAVAEQVACG